MVEDNDFITFDILPPCRNLLNIFDNYNEDSVPAKRSSVDKCINSFGKCLLELRKSTGVRIVNGTCRISGDECDNIIF
jgi:hypothetical protein